MTTTGRPPRRGTRACVTAYFDVQPFRTGVPDGRVARTGFWLSLFRFQGATGHAPVLPVVVPGGPKDCSGQIAPLESLLRRSEGLGRPFRRDAHRIRPPCHRQRVSCRRGETGSGRLERPSADPPASHVGSIRCLALILAGEPGRTRGSLRGCGRLTVPRQDLDAVPLRRWTPVPREGWEDRWAHSYTGRGVRRAAWTPRTPPGVRSSTGFPLLPSHRPGTARGSVRRPLISSIYRSCANFWPQLDLVLLHWSDNGMTARNL